MVAVTPPPACLSVLDALLDRERSRRFHEGGQPIDPRVAERLIAALGDLPRPDVAVHVAGSEGKTSTTERVARGLRAAGSTTATFTSPHLRDLRERLRIDDAFPGDDELCAAVERVTAAARRLDPSWFEFLTAVARVLFVPPRVDAVVWETGLGGRLDATRHLPADLCVITSISLEHTKILGDRVEDIAAEKAGILRPGAPVVVSANLPGAARTVVAARAAELGCSLVTADDATDDLDGRSTALARSVLATLADHGFVAPPDAAVEHALTGGVVAGRLHVIGDVLFDGAHTVEAARLLARHLTGGGAGPAHGGAAHSGRPVGAVVFGATSGRDAAAMVAHLATLGAPLVLTRAPGDRGVDPSELLRPGPDTVVEPDPEAALAAAREAARRQAGDDALVVVTGSLHLVGRLLPADAAPAAAAPETEPA